MVIVSLVSTAAYGAIVHASPAHTTHERLRGGAEVIAALRRSEYYYVLVDPSLIEDVRFEALALAAAAATIPLLLVGLPSADAVGACMFAQVVRPTNALLAATIDGGWLRFLLHKQVDVDVPGLLLHHARDAISGLPLPLRLLTAGFSTGNGIASSVRALSEAAGVSKKTLERWYSHAGLARPKQVLAIARLARIWRVLRSRRLSVGRAARLVGMGSARTLSRSCRMLAQYTPNSVRDCSHQDFAICLAQSLLPRAAPGPEDGDLRAAQAAVAPH